jgi:ADP-ribose pyrophosphatase YjhB (NUDIX family)
MQTAIQKVTAFVTRNVNEKAELHLYEHPYAGIQIPAGTVNPGESPEKTVIREVCEETGLKFISIFNCLGVKGEKLPENHRMIAEHTRVYARPDLTSFDWAVIRPGITVTLTRKDNGFSQIVYQEFVRDPDP